MNTLANTSQNRAGRQAISLLGSAVFLVIAPGGVAFLGPFWLTHYHLEPPLLGLAVTRLVGFLMMAWSVPVLLGSFWRFATEGLGTPAPVMPPEHLVVRGYYRHVRNPMYVAVVAMILGEGLFLGNARLLVYGAAVWLAMHTFVVLYEEPALRLMFDGEYEEFCRRVPRWVPRWRAWTGEER